MTVGIDAISFFTPNLYLDLTDLAKARGVDPNKFTIGIGQEKQSVVPPSQDSVTMAASAGSMLLTGKSTDYINSISEILFASESGIDNSKSGAVYLQTMLHLAKNVRTIELKQACYAGTFALMTAFDYVSLHPNERVLVVATDVARYGLKSAGEVTQGAGAVAMIVSSDPKLAGYNHDSVFQSQDLMDFWRPLDETDAIVSGKFSQEAYETFFANAWQDYIRRTGRRIADFKAFVFHLPFTKMGKKALDQIIDQADGQQQQNLERNRLAGQIYGRQVGNIYTGSLYLSLISLLDHGDVQAGDLIAMFSYGSGAEGELYSLTLMENYQQAIKSHVQKDLNARQRLSVLEYEKLFKLFPKSSDDQSLMNEYDKSLFQLAEIKNHQRIYKAAVSKLLIK
ncbi:hydroxymethylglutaryl-CoA synthase [Oenococcus sicerae]|uniref:Hydroxymethylglutaryl-CoA synthase n=1 Tax=Oenococcus sicerae TaxID=2203724 RepID=A0AAJ1R7T6_9LACO|nr:hydroxymethylglutaryl-CoA synthase [Oenococcus sicerae]MDN6899714.1 hydroxymethylglutaryl-CoA synthase [Oenococcus sicerae]